MSSQADTDLMKMFKFVADDLEFNRRGEMSPRQIAMLEGQRKNTRSGIRFAVVIEIFLVGLWLILWLTNAASSDIQVISSVCCGVMLLVLLTLALVLNDYRLLGIDLRHHHLKSVQGAAKLHTSDTVKNTFYFLTVSDVKIEIEKPIYSAFEAYLHRLTKPHHFRFCYTEGRKTILSVEVLDAANIDPLT